LFLDAWELIPIAVARKVGLPARCFCLQSFIGQWRKYSSGERKLPIGISKYVSAKQSIGAANISITTPIKPVLCSALRTAFDYAEGAKCWQQHQQNVRVPLGRVRRFRTHLR